MILPWVRVPHLASHILSKGGQAYQFGLDREIRPPPLSAFKPLWNGNAFEAFVTSAANWIYVGQTKGRCRNDRYATLKVPVKDIYLYPLTKRFREALKSERVGEQKGGQVEDDK